MQHTEQSTSAVQCNHTIAYPLWLSKELSPVWHLAKPGRLDIKTTTLMALWAVSAAKQAYQVKEVTLHRPRTLMGDRQQQCTEYVDLIGSGVFMH